MFPGLWLHKGVFRLTKEKRKPIEGASTAVYFDKFSCYRNALEAKKETYVSSWDVSFNKKYFSITFGEQRESGTDFHESYN